MGFESWAIMSLKKKKKPAKQLAQMTAGTLPRGLQMIRHWSLGLIFGAF